MPIVPLSRNDTLIEVLALILLLALWAVPIYFYGQLPLDIPSHFSATGKVDGYGPKAMLFILPSLYTLIYSLLSWLGRKPQILNYPVAITDANAAFQYRNAITLLRWLKAMVGIVLFVVVIVTIRTALYATNSISAWLLPISLLLILVPVGYFLYRSFSGK